MTFVSHVKDVILDRIYLKKSIPRKELLDLGNPGNLDLVLCVRHKNTVMLIYQKNTLDERRVGRPSVVLVTLTKRQIP